MRANTGLRFTVVILVLAILVVVIPVSQPAHAAGLWYVAPGGNDSNDCLDSTIACATINGALNKPGFVAGDTIRVAIGTYTGTGGEVVLLSKSATLSGGWNTSFITQSGTSTIDGQVSRIGISVNDGVTAVVERFLVQNSTIGVICNTGTMTLNNSTVSNNASAGIDNSGTLTLNNSTVSGNTGGWRGGGIHNFGSVTLNNSTVSQNTGDRGGGIYNGGGTVTLNNSVVSGNQALGYLESGGGIHNGGGTVTLNNSTVSGNTSKLSGGGICVRGNGNLTLNNCTVSDNAVDEYGGGIRVEEGTATLRNTIIAQNTAEHHAPDCLVDMGQITSAGYNLIGDTSGCGFSPITGDVLNVAPGLFSLVGSPGYHPLLPNSPAIDAANPAGCTDHLGHTLSTDQRGTSRPLDGDGDAIAICDMGAYEFDPDNNPIVQVFLPITVRNYCPVLLYTDDFSDPGSGWPVSETQNTLYAYLNGEYRILVKSTGWSAGAAPGFKASDYIVAVDVRNVTGVYGSYGIIFGLSDDWRQFYTFEVDPSSNYVIWHYNSRSGWTSLASGSSGYINPGTATNRLKVERNGSLIRAYVNRQLLTSVSDGSYTGLRRVGLIVSSYDQPNVDARFDNFVVYPVTCGAGAAALREGSEASRGEVMEADLSGSNRFRVVERQERRLDLGR